MSNLQLSLLVVLALLIGGALAHLLNVKKVHNRLESLEGKTITKDDIYKDLFIPQGSNFNALAMTAWMLALVALVYLYLLTPVFFSSFNYFKIDLLASSPLGFAIFGLVAAFLGAAAIAGSDKLPDSNRCYRLTEFYGYYVLSKNQKRAIALTIPLLWISIFISAYLGTVYPLNSNSGAAIAFIILFISLVALLLPMFKEFVEEWA